MEFRYEDLLGKPFENGGRGPERYDCYGLVLEIYKRLGRPLPDYGFLMNPEPEGIDGLITESRKEFIELPKPEPFCLVTFRIHPRFTSHVGAVLEDCNRFIHIMRKCSVAVERLDSIEWKRRISGFYRY